MGLLSTVLEEAQKADLEVLRKEIREISPRLKDLTERIQMLSWSLQENLKDLYLNFTSTESLEGIDYKNKKEIIFSDYEKLSKDINSLKFDNEVNDEEFTNSYSKLEKSFSVLNDLCLAAEAWKKLVGADHDFRRYNYRQAILSVESLKDELAKIQLEGDAAKALLGLRDRTDNQLALYSAQVSLEWEEMFYWSERTSLNNIVYSIFIQQQNTALLQKILSTFYCSHSLNAELSNFSYFFIDKILHHIILYNCEIFTDEDLGFIIYNIKIDLSDSNKPNFQTIFMNLTAVFEFLQSTLKCQFEDGNTFMSVFAETIRDRFFNKIINNCIKSNLPSCDSSYKNYSDLVTELDAFNKFLIELKFVEIEDSPLNKYLEDTECLLYKKKCDKFLSEIRQLLNKSLSYGTVNVGIEDDQESELEINLTDKNPTGINLDRPLFLPKCVISQNAKQIMEIVMEHVKESLNLPDKYRNQLILYIKDAAVMYQALVPMKFKVNLELCPLDIALFFNNCFYLAHGLLGPPWRKILPMKVADSLNTVLIECIQDLRVLGLEKMSLYLQKQVDNITKSVQSNEQLHWAEDIYEEFDCAISETIMLMGDLKANWLHVLPKRMYINTMCTLVEALCQSVLNRLLTNTQEIDEELVFMIAIKIDGVIEEIKSLFEDVSELEKRINVWKKFLKMSKVMRSQLLELSDCWNKTKELKQIFTCEEIRQIIKMRFPDDAYRLKILADIQ